MPSETSAVNAAYIEARMKQFKLVDMREQYQELIRVASEQSMTYIQGWLKALKNDNKFVVSASSKAEKAINFILGE